MRTTLTVLLCTLVLGCCGSPCRSSGCQKARSPVDTPTPPPVETPTSPPPAVTPTPEEHARVLEILESKRVRGLALEGASLDAAMTYLRTITGLVFRITPAARAAMIDNRITVRLNDVSVHTALLAMLEPNGLSWRGQDSVVVMIMTRDERHPARLRYYDIKDLGARDEAADEALVAAIRKDIGGNWEARGWSIEARRHILIVRAPRRVHDAVDAYLASRRSQR